VRWLALAVAVAGFLVTIPLYTGFDAAQAGMQFVEQLPWITRFNVQYLLGVDGISMPFILLNSLVTVLVVLAGWEVIEGQAGAVHGRLPDHVRPDERHLQRARRRAVLRLLRGLADPDVHHHRRLGRTEPRLRGLQVLPLHAARLAADAGCPDLAVPRVGGSFRSSTGTSCRSAWRRRS
jgi:hypothetical protein